RRVPERVVVPDPGGCPPDHRGVATGLQHRAAPQRLGVHDARGVRANQVEPGGAGARLNVRVRLSDRAPGNLRPDIAARSAPTSAKGPPPLLDPTSGRGGYDQSALPSVPSEVCASAPSASESAYPELVIARRTAAAGYRDTTWGAAGYPRSRHGLALATGGFRLRHWRTLGASEVLSAKWPSLREMDRWHHRCPELASVADRPEGDGKGGRPCASSVAVMAGAMASCGERWRCGEPRRRWRWLAR